MLTSAWLQNGQLWIEGTDGSDNIEIRFEGDQISIANTPILTEFGDFVDSVSLASVPQQVIVHALDGDDVVRAVEIGVVASPSLTVFGGWGNDRLTGSSGHDHLFGEGGNDELSGLAGDDTLSGGIGSDRFDGASGWDSVVETNLLNAVLEDSRLQTTRLNRYPLQGDTNHDGRIDLKDLNNVRNNFGSTGHGDANGDGLVNVQDLNLVRNRFGANWEESSIVEFENTDEALVSIEGGNLAASADATAGVVLNASTFSGQAVLRGAWGSDILVGGHGSDELHGGDGQDLLVGGNGNDLIFGGAGNDKLVGCHDGWAVEIGGADDRLYGDDGDDEIWGGDGNDLLVGGNGNDVAHGEGGNDKLVGCHDGWAEEVGGADDRLYGDDGDDEIWGGDGNDLLVGGNGNDVAHGEGGNDKLVGCHDGWAVEVGGADDRLYGDDGDDEIWGGDGNDLLVGGNGNDVAHGEGGNDKLVGCHDGQEAESGGADDHLYGGDGHDEIWGGAGNDVLVGGAHNDAIHGQSGFDRLYGESGDDGVFGDADADFADGGEGYDMATVDQAFDQLFNAENVSVLNIPIGSPQDDQWSCGPNSASRFLRWFGVNVSYETMRNITENEGDLFSMVHMGTRPGVLRDLISRFKPNVQLAERVDATLGLEPVLQLLGAGQPVIALVNVGGYFTEEVWPFETGTIPDALHYVVLTGFDRASQTIQLMNTNGLPETWSFGTFWSRWNWHASGLIGDFLTGTLGVRERTLLF